MRREDWPQRLTAHIAEHRARPFRYGARGHDCGTFAAGAVEAVTGVNHLPEFGAYRGAKQAAAALAREGGMLDMLEKRFPKIPPALAQRGDLGLIAAPDSRVSRLGLCVVLGETLAAPGLHGLELVPRSRLLHAFKVS